MQRRMNLLACWVVLGGVAVAQQNWLAVTCAVLVAAMLVPRVADDRAVWQALQCAHAGLADADRQRALFVRIMANRAEARAEQVAVQAASPWSAAS